MTDRKITRSSLGFVSNSSKKTNVPSLVELSIQTVIDNIQALESIGDIPHQYVDRILMGCSPAQLQHVEAKSQREDLDTEKYWKTFCERFHHFDTTTTKTLQQFKCATWKQLFLTREKEDEDKKRKFGEKLRAMYNSEQQEKSAKKIKMIEPPKKPMRGEVPNRGINKAYPPIKQSAFQGRLMQKSFDQLRKKK